ncbi:MAG: hypothetical protein SNJ79_12390, partial [Sphingomonadaceae bacterium]
MTESADGRRDERGSEPESQVRLDRLAGRASPEPDPAPPAPARPRAGFLSGLAWAAAGAGAVAAGLALAPQLRAPGDIPAVPEAPPVLAPEPAPQEADLSERLAALEAELAAARAAPPAPLPVSAGDSGAILQRLEALEAETRRLSEADSALQSRVEALAAEMASAGLTTGAMATATAEARTLFAVLAARRFVDRGRPLGAF